MGKHTGRHPSGGLTSIAILLAVATVVGMYVLRPTGNRRPDINQFGAIKDTYDARIESTRVGSCGDPDPNAKIKCQAMTIRLLEGPDKDKTFTQQTALTAGAPRFAAGDKIIVGRQKNAQPGFEYTYVDRHRKAPLFLLAAVFALAVLLLGRLRGAAALAGLVATFAVLLAFIAPAILDGRSPVAVALIGASAIAFLALYLAHGFNRRTTIALLGTLGGLGVTAILVGLFQGVLHLTGFTEEGNFLLAVGAQDSLAGLMLGGVIIGALGAIDDITVTQASAIWELNQANPSLGRSRLFMSGMRIGRDHVASTVNTLALAYVGASMPILLFIVLSNQSLGTVANGEFVATEIFRTLVGSIGLIASVPITTLLAARLVTIDSGSARKGEPEDSRVEEQNVEDPGAFFIPERKRDAFRAALRPRPPEP